MKSIICVAILLATTLACSIVVGAGFEKLPNDNNAVSSRFIKVTLYNRANVDIAVMILETVYSTLLPLPVGTNADYKENISIGADYAAILVMQCFDIQHSVLGDICTKPGVPIACNDGQHYDFHKIKKIYFNADLKTCTVVCANNSETSCKV